MTRKKGKKEEPEPIPDTSEDKKDSQKKKNAKEEKGVEEKPEDDDEIRIGVYVCHCGLNIAGVIDCEKVAEYASKLPDVAVAREDRYICADPGQELIKKLHEIDPAVKAIVSSGYSTDPIMANFREYGFHGVVAKPYQAGDLERTLRMLMYSPSIRSRMSSCSTNDISRSSWVNSGWRSARRSSSRKQRAIW